MRGQNSIPRARTLFCLGCIALVCTFYWDIVLLKRMYRSRNSLHNRHDWQNTSYGWSWMCVEETDGTKSCQRLMVNRLSSSWFSMATCSMTCNPGRHIWPLPNGDVRIKNTTASFHPRQFTVDFNPVNNADLSILLKKATRLFQERISNLAKESRTQTKVEMFNVTVKVKSNNDFRYNINIDESYKITVVPKGLKILASITASTFLGAHHGMETLAQLIWWDEKDRVLKVLNSVSLSDAPRFTYRGFMIDTAKHFIPVSSIIRSINTMSMTKLNVFHWHLTDSKSFPYVSKHFPGFAKSGPYSSTEIYSSSDIREVVEYAEVRGVTVLLEVSSPAHASQGWDWGEDEGKGNLSLCLGSQPFFEFCAEPPCGQLNPVNNNSYVVIVQLLKELKSLTRSKNILHIGGEDIDFRCWESFGEVTDTEIYMEKGAIGIWEYFYKTFIDKLIAAKVLPKYFVLWSNELLGESNIWHHLKHGPPIVQSRGPSTSGELESLVRKKFRVVVSSSDAWDLSEPQAWQVVYHHKPWMDLTLADRKYVLGGEALVWTDHLDSHSLDVQVWPAAAALAERLWTDPGSSFTPVDRLAHFRERLVEARVPSSPVGPKWCLINPNQCV